MIAAIRLTPFSGCTVPEICAMGGITVEDFTSSVAYREIFGLGRQEGRQESRQESLQEGQEKAVKPKPSSSPSACSCTAAAP